MEGLGAAYRRPVPYVNLEGRRLHYLDVGTGNPPLLLIHAFPLGAEMWAPQTACLSGTHRVIAPDLAGFGASDPMTHPRHWSMDRYVADVVDLLDALHLDRVVLVGLSMGGYIAFSFLRSHSDRVAALVLADTRAAADTEEVRTRRRTQQNQVEREGTGALRRILVQGLLAPESLVSRPTLVDEVHRQTNNHPAAFVAALQAMSTRPDHTPDLAGIEVPTLVLVGEADAPSPPAVVRSWQELITGSQLVVLPRAGHLSNLEAPAEFNAALVDFLPLVD